MVGRHARVIIGFIYINGQRKPACVSFDSETDPGALADREIIPFIQSLSEYEILAMQTKVEAVSRYHCFPVWSQHHERGGS